MPRRTPVTDKSATDFAISLVNQQSAHAVDERKLVDAVRRVLEDSEFSSGDVSVAVVDDATIHELNRRFLGHDRPTDVLSFVLQIRGQHLEGEIVLSADTAAASAAEIGWPAAAEQLLYAIHGALHLVGYDDGEPSQSLRMRDAEAKYLEQLDIASADLRA